MSISLAEGRENCSQILLGVYPIENKKTTTTEMSCWFSQSHLLTKILYTELKETDSIKLQLDCQLSNRLIPVLQAHDLYHVGVVSLMVIHYKEMKITKKKVLSLLPGSALIISFISFTSIQRFVRKLLKY